MITSEKEKIQELLGDTITTFCKSTISYKSSLSIKSEVVVVVDGQDTLTLTSCDDVLTSDGTDDDVGKESLLENLNWEVDELARAVHKEDRLIQKTDIDENVETYQYLEHDQTAMTTDPADNAHEQRAEDGEYLDIIDDVDEVEATALDHEEQKNDDAIPEKTSEKIERPLGNEDEETIVQEYSVDVDDDLEGFVFAEETPDISLYKVNGMYRCPFCPFVNTHGSALRVHLTIHSKKKHNHLKCMQCGKVFTRVHTLKMHIKSMHMTKVKCRKCGELFSSKPDIRKHQCAKRRSKTKGSKETTCCPHCSYTSIHPGNLKRHIKGHTEFTCLVCKEDFANHNALRLHLKKSHKDMEEIKEVQLESLPSPAGAYSCKGCSFSCTSEAKLKTHRKTLKEEEQTCEYCGVTFVCRPARKNHMREFHPLELKKKVCEFCNKVFMSFQGLYTHRKVVHADEIDQDKRTMHFCHVCGKGFPVFMYLTRHMKSHDDSQPYQCPKCNRRFKYHRNFKTHKEGCLNTSGYPCHICGKSLKTDYNLKLHYRTIHAEERQYYPCRKCGTRFSHKQSRNKHEKVSCFPSTAHGDQPQNQEVVSVMTQQAQEELVPDQMEDGIHVAEEIVETEIPMEIPVEVHHVHVPSMIPEIMSGQIQLTNLPITDKEISVKVESEEIAYMF